MTYEDINIKYSKQMAEAGFPFWRVIYVEDRDYVTMGVVIHMLFIANKFTDSDSCPIFVKNKFILKTEDLAKQIERESLGMRVETFMRVTFKGLVEEVKKVEPKC